MRERFCICLICIVTICCVGCSSEVKDNNEVSSYIDSEFQTPQNNSGMNTQTNNNRNTNSSHIDSNHHSDNEHHEDDHH